ncbi:MAG: response regulator transcription factor [Verrucomicrobia bacterium]|jgi:two-component system, NarL family, response regulator NreC|nr:response regulator transcription factor [Verrucomicrobiota bacterium]
MSVKVFLADDHRIFRQGLRGLLAEESDITIVGEADDGRDAIAKISKSRPDVVLMDVGMPGLNGIEATRQLKKVSPRVKVVGLSMHVDERFVGEMLRAGAIGYLCKKCDIREVLTAIRSAAVGQTYLSPMISGSIVEGYVLNACPESSSAFSQLTNREREVLQLLVEEMTIKEIAFDLGLSAKTVHAHREHLMQKLDVHTIAGLTKYAVRQGLTEL